MMEPELTEQVWPVMANDAFYGRTNKKGVHEIVFEG